MLMLLKFNGFPYSQSSNKKARIIHAHAVPEERTKIMLLKGYQTIRERPDCSRVYFCHIELLTFSWPFFFFCICKCIRLPCAESSVEFHHKVKVNVLPMDYLTPQCPICPQSTELRVQSPCRFVLSRIISLEKTK